MGGFIIVSTSASANRFAFGSENAKRYKAISACAPGLGAAYLRRLKLERLKDNPIRRLEPLVRQVSLEPKRV